MPQNFGPSTGSGQYYATAIQGNLYHGGNQAVVATALAAGLVTAHTGGLVLANPIASTVNLVIQRAQASFVVAQTNAAAIGLGIGVSATPLAGTLTAVPSVNANPGSASTAAGKLYSSAAITLPVAPYLAKILGTVNTGAETTEVDSTPIGLDLQGAIVLPPGGFACFTSSAAGTASSFFGSFTWLEVPAV